MTFTDYIVNQITLHPSMQPQDFVKLCYQAAFGAEHLLLNTERAKAYFMQEWDTTPADSEQPLYEEISEHVCRINLAAWKAQHLDPETLFAKFAASATITTGSKELFEDYLKAADLFILTCTTACTDMQPPVSPAAALPWGHISFTSKNWTDFLKEYKKAGCPAVHHSESYRQAEHPAYRIIRKEYLEEPLSS